MSDGDKKDDATHLGGAPPVAPKLPSAAPPGAAPGSPPPPKAPDDTHVGSAPPRLPRPGMPPSPPPPAPQPIGRPVAPTVEPAEDDGEETVAIAPVTQRTPFSLQRVQPPGHAGVIYLTRDTYLVGRKQGADLPLFSPTASREHARLERRGDGWYVAPVENKTVVANGSSVHAALRLEHKMRLQIGGDELIFFDESSATRAATSASAAAAPAGTRRRWLWVLIICVLAAAGVGLAWLLRWPNG
jgi:pSer/pThr/pTyr-binding forkhead associated (FHA) protein